MAGLFSTNQVLLILALIGVSVGNGRSCMEHERAALLSIKSDIWSDWRGFNCCSWAGITCDEITGHVVGLALHYPFPFDSNVRPSPIKVNPSLSQLSHLKYLDLSMNNFDRAPIPDSITSLRNLTHLNLSNNYLSGNIPQNISALVNLQYLDLSSNSIYGEIPDEITELRGLGHLLLSNNHLSGNIPQNISALVNLQYLDLSSNSIYGEIPDEITELRGLIHLLLSNNHLSGNIPQNISALMNLQFLDLSYNYLSGSIPPNLAAIFDLDLSFNNLSGKVPLGIDPVVLKCNPNLFLSLQYECNAHPPTPDIPDQEDGDDSKLLEIIWSIIGFVPGYTLGFWGFAAVVLVQHERRIAYFQLIDTVSDWFYQKAVMPLTWIYQIIG